MSDERPVPGTPPAADQPPADPRIGQLIAGKYRLVSPLARGGMARIWRAEQEPLGRIVALKEMLPPRDGTAEDPAFQKRFFIEASTLSKLTHPNTVRVFDYGQQEDGSYYMVMEYVEGRSLQQVLRDEGSLDPMRAVHITVEILRSLQEAHAAGIVHRDLKPGNVMLVHTVEGEAVKVLDFGIAKVLQEETANITMDGRIVGSPRYMAPEQIRQGDIDGRTDLYALGCVLYELICGRAPFVGERTLQILMAHINTPAPSLAARSPHVPPALDAIVASCLAKEPAARPASAEALRDALREVLVDLAGASTTGARLETEGKVREALDRAASAATDSGRKRLPLEPEGSDDPTAISQPTLAGPTPPERGRSPLLLLIPLLGAGLLLLLVGIGVLAFVLNPFAGDDPAIVDAPEHTELVEPLAPEEPDEEPAPEAPAVVLTVTSTPVGAEVWEGNRNHGVTPLELPLGEEALSLELRLDGHESHPFVVEPAEAPVAHHADLVPVPAAPAPRPKPRPALDDILIER